MLIASLPGHHERRQSGSVAPTTCPSGAAGIPTFETARMMGTSIEQIEKTHGHLLPDALDRGRAALEAFDRRADSVTVGL